VPSTEDQTAPVQTKAVLIEPVSMTVLWMNESAAQDFADGNQPVAGVPVAQAVPLSEILAVPESLRVVAETGVSQRMKANLVTTTQGSLAIVASVYRLPDGKLLLLIENAWQARQDRTGENPSQRRGRRTR